MNGRTLAASELTGLMGARAGRGPAYRRLALALRQAVLDGRIPLAARLPGERDLAAALGLSRTTVAAAYTALRDEGFLVTRPGARAVTAVPGEPRLPAPLPRAAPASSLSPAPDLLDLAHASLPAPEGAASRAYRDALHALPAHLPTHGYAPLGLPVLREAIAARYAARGLPTDPAQIVVTFGAQHALGLLVRALAAPGERALVDAPTYPHALDALRAAGLGLVPVPLTDAGWDPRALAAALRQTSPRLAYLIPDFHNPTGHLMPPEERAALARAASLAHTTLIVDETLADLALDGPPPAPFAAHDPRGEVVTVGSASKSFWGGLRVGWIRAPRDVVARVAAVRASVDLGTPVVEQLATARLLADADEVLAVRRAELRHRRDALATALARHLPDWRFALPPGGLSVWATLPAPASSALAATAERFGVRVTAGARFGADGLYERALRVPFALPEADLEEAIHRLARAWTALGVGPARSEDALTLV